MPTNSAPAPTDELTIISHSLLRTPAEEWEEPTHLFQRIRGTALAEIIAEVRNPKSEKAAYNRQRSLLMFDCMLRVMDEPEITSILQLGTKRFGELQDVFYSALASDKFNALSSSVRITYARAFYRLFETLQEKFQVRLASFKPNSNKKLSVELADLFDNTILSDDEVAKLRPFLLTPESGKDYNVLLAPMVPHLGLPLSPRIYGSRRVVMPNQFPIPSYLM